MEILSPFLCMFKWNIPKDIFQYWSLLHGLCFYIDSCENSWLNNFLAITGVLICRGGRLLTGSVGHNLRMWSVVGVGEMRLPGDNNNMRGGGLTMEDEMNLDGEIVSAAFDESLDMVINLHVVYVI